ncbi:uncharacterized protein LOC129258397 [Lytechinus pictus]|uniref:uncharacterized protein LOC129258397 n=1 Tax=Lytechinus pictus TaxID=7653 RepID=UPI0030B9D1C1
MAMAFSEETTDFRCQMCTNDDCSETVANYTLNSIRKNLCNGCAKKCQQNIVTDKVLNKWTCHKHHTRRAEIFCEDHQSIICHNCATTSHKPCDIREVEEILDERRCKLQRMIEETKQLGKSEASVEKLVAEASTHLAKVEVKMQEAIHEAIEYVEEEGKQTLESINKEADREIEQINIRRAVRLKKNLAVIDQGRQDILKRQCILQDELQLLMGKLNDCAKTCLKNQSSAIENSRMKAETLIKNEILLLKNYSEVEGEMMQSLQKDNVERLALPIVEKARQVNFERESGPNLGILQGLDGSWVLKPSLTVDISEPALVGFTNKKNVIVIDKRSDSLVLVDFQEQQACKVVNGEFPRNIYRLALLDDEKVACGTTDGSLFIFQKQTWEFIERVPLYLGTPVILAVDNVSRNRRILAVAQGECIINIVSQESNEVTSSVSVKDTPIIDIAVLWQGDIVVRTRCASGDDLAVLNRNDFTVTSVTHFHDKYLRSITADQGRDALYIRHFDPNRQKCSVEEMRLMDGKLTSVGSILEFSPLKNKWPMISADCCAPEQGKLVLLRGKQIMVYTKRFLT